MALRFRVGFFKTVCGDTGHEVDAPQGSFLVDAADEATAVELAKQQFCRLRRIEEWSINADRFEVKIMFLQAERPRRRLRA